MIAVVAIVLAFVAPGLIFVAVRAIRRTGPTARRERFVKELASAAVADDMEMLGTSMRQGSVNYATAQGDTALHYAYYTGEQNAIDNLRAYGADENLRNNEGLTPRDMADLAATEDRLRRGVRCLNSDGIWRARDSGLHVYHQLQGSPGSIYNPAVVRQVLEPEHRRELLILAIKVGKAGSQEKLAEALDAFGDKTMAEDYLNAGSPFLQQAAHRWAWVHNYKIYRTPGAVNIVWGQF
ncbi:ankyrin repeat domain-containing protein [Nocardia nova]|uniref:ankyrin repeat domain-containing protein n=1 Tax=Nocardia nova TaxID=37330 RepID=UPI0033F58396